MLRQFTATAYIIESERVLMIYHRKLQKWLPPGGHIDENELPYEAAIREALEETGVEIEILSDEHIWVNRWNASSIPRPFLSLLEEIPEYKDQPAHQHIDFIFAARPVGGAEIVNHQETGGLKWFTLHEVENLEEDVEIFAETKQVIATVFKRFKEKDLLCARNLCSSPLQAST